jgi:hypothetical protein
LGLRRRPFGRRRGISLRIGDEAVSASRRTEEEGESLVIGSKLRRRRIDGHAADRIANAAVLGRPHVVPAMLVGVVIPQAMRRPFGRSHDHARIVPSDQPPPYR